MAKKVGNIKPGQGLKVKLNEPMVPADLFQEREAVALVAEPLVPEAKEEFAPVVITQSFIKQMRDYLEGGSCGNIIRVLWIEKRHIEYQSAAMSLGCYFEYILTGALPKNGKVPQPQYMKSAITKNKGSVVGLGVEDMLDPYRKAHANAKKVADTWQAMGLEIYNPLNAALMAGVTLRKKVGDGIYYEGTIDVVLRAFRDTEFKGYSMKQDDKINGDLKYSGMLDDKWSVHGWQWTPIQKKYHGTQGKQYKLLNDLDQSFWIVDPNGSYLKWFICEIDNLSIKRHVEEGNALHEKLMYLHDMGLLEARPESDKCADCPLFSECADKHTFPHPVRIDLTVDGV